MPLADSGLFASHTACASASRTTEQVKRYLVADVAKARYGRDAQSAYNFFSFLFNFATWATPWPTVTIAKLIERSQATYPD
jgi:hypothetical protein